MPLLFDALYLVTLLALSPWLLWRAFRTGRYRAGLRDKLLGLSRPPPPGAVWFHGVSVGEVHLLRPVVAEFRRRRPDLACVVSTTTDAGFAEAERCFPDLLVFRFPFDFSWAVRRTLRTLRPALVVLAESEVWPNFLLAARRQGVPVAVVNGRMSPRSFARWRRLGPLGRWLWRSFDLLAVQTEEYAAHVRALGAPAERVAVTGSVKFDGAQADRHNPRTNELRRLLGVAEGNLVWVAGSTVGPEEEVVLGVFARARGAHPGLRLLLVPRQPDRFDEVARLLEQKQISFIRRSHLTTQPPNRPTAQPPVVLVDTLGELGAVWGLADVAFVGGSLDGKRGGQNMIEPAAYGAAVTFGPHVWNFRDTVARLVACGGALRVGDEAELKKVIFRLLGDAGERQRLGAAARAFVREQQGATARTVALLQRLLPGRAAAA